MAIIQGCCHLTGKMLNLAAKGPSTLAVFASVSPSAMAPPPNCFLCAITYMIAREKQRKQLVSGAIADGETDAKNASVGSRQSSNRKDTTAYKSRRERASTD
jgi:hypothetical protein